MINASSIQDTLKSPPGFDVTVVKLRVYLHLPFGKWNLHSEDSQKSTWIRWYTCQIESFFIISR